MELRSIILAGGDGTRLRSLTRRLHGDDRPKQFAVVKGERSMLQETLHRMSDVVPSERTVVVVADGHSALAREQLSRHRGVELVRQPSNLGTAPGILLPLAHVMAKDPAATVVITPSDHHFARPERFTGKLQYAALAASASPSGVCLVAVDADDPSTDLGWIVPGQPLPSRPGANVVAGFVEKPDGGTARRLHREGALWNTFVMVGQARSFWRLAERALPAHVQLFDVYRRSIGATAERLALQRLYGQLTRADFSRDVLTRAPGLSVVSVGKCGWSDWGTPDRLRSSLVGTPDLVALDRRLEGDREFDSGHEKLTAA